jgi:hypothetical protein
MQAVCLARQWVWQGHMKGTLQVKGKCSGKQNNALALATTHWVLAGRSSPVWPRCTEPSHAGHSPRPPWSLSVDFARRPAHRTTRQTSLTWWSSSNGPWWHSWGTSLTSCSHSRPGVLRSLIAFTDAPQHSCPAPLLPAANATLTLPRSFANSLLGLGSLVGLASCSLPPAPMSLQRPDVHKRNGPGTLHQGTAA